MEPTSCSSSFIDSFYFMSTEIRSHPFLCAVFWGQAAFSVGWRPLFCPEKCLHTSLEGQTRMILWVDPRETQFARNEQVRLAFDACMYQIGWVVVSNSTIFNYIYIYFLFFHPIYIGLRPPLSFAANHLLVSFFWVTMAPCFSHRLVLLPSDTAWFHIECFALRNLDGNAMADGPAREEIWIPFCSSFVCSKSPGDEMKMSGHKVWGTVYDS